MTKLYLILYTLVTSLLYTALVAYFSTASSSIALGYVAAILIAATAVIAFGREKIADIDHNKKINEKDEEIAKLNKEIKQKKAMLHSVKARVIHVVINVSDKDELLTTMRDLASMLNENPAINNIDLGDDVDAFEYLDLMRMSSRAK
ncbi:hypothetical protein ICJ54_13805 [Pseudomonas asiatica]|uniref:hypothetical protein n=1 Tax=Pseudomonas asiatica TaxID=2219225 RepID=UPI00166674EB|nr:hypothetical protein [Pseudomonas asiatica]QNT38661.1 hypothetical protein ICJ54_13805 [Pseudomonas asiatica]